MRTPAAWLGAAVLLVTGCSRSSSQGGAPTVKLSPTEDFDVVRLSWVPPSEGVESYDVQVRIAPGAFREKLHVDSHYVAIGVDLHDEPELSDMEIRLVVNPGARASNVVSFRRGVRPPLVGCCTIDPSGAYVVTVQNRSLVADQVTLEREAVYWDGTGATWSALPLQAGASEYVDADLSQWIDGAAYWYWGTALKGTEASPRNCCASTAAALLAAPVVTSAAVIDGAVHLAFQNQSMHTPEVQVYRQARLEQEKWLLAVLPAPDTGATGEFVDTGAQPGSYVYFLRGWDRRGPEGLGLWRWSDLVPVRIVVPPAASTGFTAALRTVPPGELAARDPSGTFITVAPLLYPSSDPGWLARVYSLIVESDPVSGTLRLPDATYLETNGGLSRPGIVLDPAGTPHSVYAELPLPWDGSSDVPIVHAWHDGLAWRSEEIARRPTDRVWFAMGGDGVLRASWFDRVVGIGPGGPLELATRRDGTWTVEDVGSALGPSYPSYWMRQLAAVDEAGYPHILVLLESSPPSHIFQDQSGWHIEDVPCQPDLVNTYGYEPRQLVAWGGRISVVLNVYDWATRTYFVETVDRGAAGWEAPVRLPAGEGAVAAARSDDGARMAVLVADGAGVRVWLRDAGSSVDHGWFHAGAQAAVGFDPSGKAWLLSWLVTDPQPAGTVVPAMLFEEL